MLNESLKSIFYFNEFTRDRFVADVAKTLPAGTKVLDAGAGTCKYKKLFAHCDYKAQDFARYEGTEHKYGELDFIGDITSIDVPDQSFDCVVCTEVFEHIPRPDLALMEFSRILRPNGLLFITAPLGSGIHMAPFHFYGGFTPFWYAHFLPVHGFKIEECRANGGFFRLYGQESQRFVTLLTPQSRLMRVAFFPVKALLALWFRLAMPVTCYFLDRLDTKREFTAGYFVRARKI